VFFVCVEVGMDKRDAVGIEDRPSGRRTDRDVRRRRIEEHLGIVASLARRYSRAWGVPFEDLYGEGALALVQAVDGYDPDRGMKLSTYATWWVKAAIRRGAMAQSRPVRVPESVWEKAGELSSSLSEDEREEVRRFLLPAASLEAPVGDGTGLLAELLPDPWTEDPAEEVAREDARHRLADALSTLPEREKTVLAGRVGLDGEPRTLTDIGKSLGVSRERARQLHDAALKKLRGRRGELGLEGLAA
jgi:RNA polymerase primary sigma factor